jgi:OOP family OmpA-OmpF porin
MQIERLRPSAHLRPFTLSALLAACLAWAPAQSQEARIEAYGPAFEQSERAPVDQARVYAYRPANALNPAPINLYLNGRYHASLLKGGYTEFCLSPGRVAVQPALDDASQMHQGKNQVGQPLMAQVGRVVYLKVQDTPDRQVRLQTLAEPQALPEIRQARRQQHTISRAPEVQICNAPAPEPVKETPPPKPLPKQEITLSSDTLFEFGKSTLRPEGEEAIASTAKQVLDHYGRVERIAVVGYTDAIGSKEVNRKLSTERANTVANLLNQNGLHPARGYITTGRGSAELAKLGCQNTPTPENKACHAPNRRVVIAISGTPK